MARVEGLPKEEGRKDALLKVPSLIFLFLLRRKRTGDASAASAGSSRLLGHTFSLSLSLSLSLNGGLALFSRPTQLTGGAGAATLLICAFLVDRLFAPCRYCASCFRPLSVSSSSNSYCEATLCRSALVECNPTKPISRDGLKSAPWVAYIFCLALPGSCSAKQVHFLGRVSTQYRVTRYP